MRPLDQSKISTPGIGLAMRHLQHDDSDAQTGTLKQSIEDGSWGTCQACGRLIEADRLLLDPGVRVCVSCQ